MKDLLSLIFLFVPALVQAADHPYSVHTISPDLKKNAHIIKRSEEITFEMFSLTETVLTKKYAVTVLNENGDRMAALSEYYDRLKEIKSITGTLYDASGNVLKKLKNKDIEDIKTTDGISLLDDSRVKTHSFYHKTYPYTVEYEVVIKHNHTYYIDPWIPQESENMSVENSRLTVRVPNSYTIRFRNLNYKDQPVITQDKNKKVMEWRVKDLPAITRPFASPVWHELTTGVFLAPTDFEIQGYKGNMTSWEDLGKFQLELNKGRQQLPDPIKTKVHQLTSGITGDREKVKVLYHYLQQTTRYISIQLGIGGWQPFEASFVAQKGYGDCKALSNYMYSLLQEAGIKSHYTIIKAGRSKEEKSIIEDFVFKQSNHVILCVPLQKDTMWLECTSQTTPAGYMGSFTGNRKALLVDETGGKLVSTPRYTLNDNTQIRLAKGTIDGQGNLETEVKTIYRGIQQDDLQGMIHALPEKKIKEHLNEKFDLPTYEVKHFRYDEKREAMPELAEELMMTVQNYATITGKRLFITPNLLTRSYTKIPEDTARKHDYVFDNEYKDMDTVEITIPDGYTPEVMPRDVNLETKYGIYRSSLKLTGNKVTYIRIREHFAGRFPAREYAELARFYEAIYKADRNRLVLVKKE